MPKRQFESGIHVDFKERLDYSSYRQLDRIHDAQKPRTVVVPPV